MAELHFGTVQPTLQTLTHLPLKTLTLNSLQSKRHSSPTHKEAAPLALSLFNRTEQKAALPADFTPRRCDCNPSLCERLFSRLGGLR